MHIVFRNTQSNTITLRLETILTLRVMKGSREELAFLPVVADGKNWKILPLRATWKYVAIVRNFGWPFPLQFRFQSVVLHKQAEMCPQVHFHRLSTYHFHSREIIGISMS